MPKTKVIQAPGFATADAPGRYRGDATLIDDDLEYARFYSPGAPRAAWVRAEVGF